MLRRKSVIAIGRILLLLALWAFIAYLFRDVDAVWDAFEDASPRSAVHRGYLLTNFLLSVAFVLIVRRPAPVVVTTPGTGFRLLGGPLS